MVTINANNKSLARSEVQLFKIKEIETNKKYIISFVLLFFLLNGCRSVKKDSESPLVVIIKMQSAEQLLEFEEAKKYVDVNKVYRNPDNDTASAEDLWKSMLVSQNNLGK